MADALGSLLKGAGILTSNLLASMGMASGTEAIVDARMVRSTMYSGRLTATDLDLRRSTKIFAMHVTPSLITAARL
jgi:hypothetical protein